MKTAAQGKGDKIVSFWVRRELKQKIARVAEKKGISRSELVRNAVEAYVEKKEAC
jgi:metal-responsive CopG/Arc/MetJ family transcriptional regulator